MPALKHNLQKQAVHQTLPGQKPLKLLDFLALKLSNKKEFLLPAQTGECFLLILSGTARVRVGEKTFDNMGRRESVFGGGASGVFVPAGQPLSLLALSPACEAALCFSRKKPLRKSLKPFCVFPESLTPRAVGRDRFARTVTDVLGAQHAADHLLIGETVSEGGMWSSYPPHKHDRLEAGKEHPMEELYYYRTEIPNRFGMQSLFSEGGRAEKNFRVHNNAVVLIPKGYHPVVAPPDSRLYYLWVLSGPVRELKYHQLEGYS